MYLTTISKSIRIKKHVNNNRTSDIFTHIFIIVKNRNSSYYIII